MKRLALNTLVAVAVTAAVISSSGVHAQQQTPPPATAPVAPIAAPSSVENIANNVCRGVISAETGISSPGTTISSCKETADSGLGFISKRIINVFSIVVGIVSVIMIIVGGFRYIISGGDSSSVQGAKNTILYAIVGLVIVLFAQVIIRFVLTNLASGI